MQCPDPPLPTDPYGHTPWSENADPRFPSETMTPEREILSFNLLSDNYKQQKN